jgi:hypothetical protein
MISIQFKLTTFFLSILIISCDNSTQQTNAAITQSIDTQSLGNNEKTSKNNYESNNQNIFFQSLIGKKLYDIGRDATENSYPNSQKSIRYQKNSEESQLEILFEKDSICQITFKPILHKEIVKKKIKWKYIYPDAIELENDLFAKIEVANNAYPLSQDKFYDYFLIMKEIKITKEGIQVDVRNTNRENFFAQYIVAENENKTSNEREYAHKILKELTFDYNLVWRYFYYYGL